MSSHVGHPRFIEASGGILQARFDGDAEIAVNVWPASGLTIGTRFYVGAPFVPGDPDMKFEGPRRRSFQRRALVGFLGGAPADVGYTITVDRDGDLVAERVSL